MFRRLIKGVWWTVTGVIILFVGLALTPLMIEPFSAAKSGNTWVPNVAYSVWMIWLISVLVVCMVVGIKDITRMFDETTTPNI